MAGQNDRPPIIIRRKKITAGEGHHGGAWKVAYADFVTAMMAFFMLMWLLNATTEKQRKGIADYFNPTIPINRISGGGEGAFGGDSVFAEETIAQNGTGGTRLRPDEERQARGETGADHAREAEDRALGEIEAQLMGRSGESMTMQAALRHVVTRITDEGLIVELFDLPDVTLFAADTARPEPVLRDLMAMVAEVFAMARNGVAVNGHTRSYPVIRLGEPDWTLSAARAQAARALLQGEGFPPDRLRRISGHADRTPAVPDRTAARNNRLELILLRKDR